LVGGGSGKFSNLITAIRTERLSPSTTALFAQPVVLPALLLTTLSLDSPRSIASTLSAIRSRHPGCR